MNLAPGSKLVDWTAAPLQHVVERLTEVPALERHAALAGRARPRSLTLCG